MSTGAGHRRRRAAQRPSPASRASRRPPPCSSPSASSARARSSSSSATTEVEALSLELAKAQKIPTEVCRDVITEAVESVLAEDYLAEGGVDYARSVLMRSLGEDRADEIIGRLAATIERRPFEFLRRTPAEQIVVFLRNESPQTIALVISNLHTMLAAQVLSQIDPEIQADVALRIAMMAETRPEVVSQVENVMRSRLSAVGAQEYAAAGGVKSLADILNSSDRSTERNVLDELAKADGELAEEIRLLLFTFEDVVKLDDRSIQMVLKEVDQKDLAIALRGVSEDVRGRIFGNMSERGAELLREEIDFQPPQRKRVVEEAQGRIVGVVRRLEEAGAIVISRGGGSERTRWSRWASSPSSTSRRCEPLAAAGGRRPTAAAVMDVLAEARPRPTQLREAREPRATPPGAPRRWPRWSRPWPRWRRPSSDVRAQQAAAADGARAPRRRARAGAGVRRSSPARSRSSPSGSSTRSRARCAGSSSASASPCSSTRTTSRSSREAMEGIKASLGGIEHCVVEAERRVGRGGCIVRTPVGDVDARVETKLERAARSRRRRARPLMFCRVRADKT